MNNHIIQLKNDEITAILIKSDIITKNQSVVRVFEPEHFNGNDLCIEIKTEIDKSE